MTQKQPRNHTEEKREGRGEEKRTPGTHNLYIGYFGDSFYIYLPGFLKTVPLGPGV